MTVAFVAAGTPVQNGSTAKPAGVAVGDMMIAFTATRGVSTFSDVSPWTLIAQHDSGSTIIAWWKVAEAGDPAAWNLEPSSVNTMRGVILAYSGVDTTTPIDAYSTAGGSGPDVSWSSVTAAEPTFIVGALDHVSTDTSVTDPTGVTVRWPPLSAAGGEAQGYGWDKSVGAGASGTFATSFPTAGSNGWGSLLIALRPTQPSWTVGRVAFGTRGAWH